MAALEEAGVAAVYTPKDVGFTRIMGEVVALVERAHRPDAVTAEA